jgi:excisionase family DNA binding protein
LGGSDGLRIPNAEEVAEYLRLPLSTVYKLVQDKKLPGFKVGKHWRFRREAFQEWIRKQETDTFKEQDSFLKL